MDLCRLCNNRPVFIRKRKLCSSCYQKLYREGKITRLPVEHSGRRGYRRKDMDSITSHQTINKYEHLGELEFIKSYFNYSDWIPQPANFYLDGFRYTPDFYDAKRNVFIEVSRTRQAYSYNRKKYQLFRELFPKLNFEIRKPTGEILSETEHIYPQLKESQDLTQKDPNERHG